MISDEKSPHQIVDFKGTQSKTPYARPVLRRYGDVKVLTLGTRTNGNDSGPSRTNASDSAVKQNIVRIGDHPFGFGLYLFDYKPEFRAEWGHGRQFGVMADEVEAVIPAAVSVHANGFKVVDYAKLGIVQTLH